MADANRDEKQRQRKWNPNTLSTLVENGIDLHTSRSIVNVFHVKTEEDIAGLSKLMEGEGMRIVEIIPPDKEVDDKLWSLHAEVTLVPEIGSIHAMTDRCVDLASSLGADYDGWYTQV